jgi:peptidoglycan biosynthesis protein MviN/MurJ (putative lipid II flippase)
MQLRWHSAADAHRSILTALVSVAAFAVAGKLVTAVKEIAVAWRFGVSVEVDAYLFVFNLLNWVILVWFSVLTVVLIPLEARIRREAPDQLRLFRAELLGAALVLGLLTVAVAKLAIPLLLSSHLIGLPVRTVRLAREIVPGLSWLALPGMLVSLYSTWMMSGGRNANTLLEGVPSMGILVAVLVASGIGSLVWGTLLGVVLQLVCLAWPRVSSGEVRAPSLRISSPAWAAFVRGSTTVLAGQAILGVTTLVDQFFAAGLGEGAISSMGYATRVLGLVNGVVAIAVTRSTLPVFSRTALIDARRVRTVAIRWTTLLGLAGVAAALTGWALAPWIVRTLFEHGTFGAADTDAVATLLRFGLLQLPFYFASLVLVSLHSSRGGYRVLVVSGALGLLVKLAGIWLLVGALGLKALMISAAMMYLANMLLLLAVGLR